MTGSSDASCLHDGSTSGQSGGAFSKISIILLALLAAAAAIIAFLALYIRKLHRRRPAVLDRPVIDDKYTSPSLASAPISPLMLQNTRSTINSAVMDPFRDPAEGAGAYSSVAMYDPPEILSAPGGHSAPHMSRSWIHQSNSSASEYPPTPSLTSRHAGFPAQSTASHQDTLARLNPSEHSLHDASLRPSEDAYTAYTESSSRIRPQAEYQHHVVNNTDGLERMDSFRSGEATYGGNSYIPSNESNESSMDSELAGYGDDKVDRPQRVERPGSPVSCHYCFARAVLRFCSVEIRSNDVRGLQGHLYRVERFVN